MPERFTVYWKKCHTFRSIFSARKGANYLDHYANIPVKTDCNLRITFVSYWSFVHYTQIFRVAAKRLKHFQLFRPYGKNHLFCLYEECIWQEKHKMDTNVFICIAVCLGVHLFLRISLATFTYFHFFALRVP